MWLLQALFTWMPFPFQFLIRGVIVVFCLWVITGLIKRVLDVIPFA